MYVYVHILLFHSILAQSIIFLIDEKCFNSKVVSSKACVDIAGRTVIRGIYDHENEVFMECEALEEVANSLVTHDNLL